MSVDLSGLPATKYPHLIRCKVCDSPSQTQTIRSIGGPLDPTDRTERVLVIEPKPLCTGGEAHTWQTLEQACDERYRPRPENLVGLAQDLDGDYYVVNESFPEGWKVTPCCGSTVKGVENGIVCRSCFEDMSWFPDGPARLSVSDPLVRPARETAITIHLGDLS